MEMTIDRMVELLEIEHTCMLRGAHDDCDRNCADCELVQDDNELHEMYTNVIALLKENKPMKPKNIWHTIDHTSNGDCPKCGYEVNEFDNSMLCGRCGQLLDWRNL